MRWSLVATAAPGLRKHNAVSSGTVRASIQTAPIRYEWRNLPYGSENVVCVPATLFVIPGVARVLRFRPNVKQIKKKEWEKYIIEVNKYFEFAPIHSHHPVEVYMGVEVKVRDSIP